MQVEADPEAKCWLAAALLHAANSENSLGRAREALKLLHEADAADPAIDDGGPSRMAAKVYGDAPTLILGERAKTLRLYRKSEEIAPEQALAIRPEVVKARELLDRIGGIGPVPPPPR